MYVLVLVTRVPLNVEIASVYSTLEQAEIAKTAAEKLLTPDVSIKFQIVKCWPDFVAEVRAYVE